MATAKEQAFIVAVNAAAGVRQTAKAVAAAAYGFVAANYATYVTALIAADVAYATAVASAATTAGITPYVIGKEPFGGNTASIAS